MEGELATEGALSEFCLFFAKTALQLLWRGRCKKIENIIRLVFDASLDSGVLFWQLKQAGDCKWSLDDCRNEE